jgi:hypothetical protein
MAKKKTTDAANELAELQKRKAKAEDLLSQLEALFPEAVDLPAGDRRGSQGRMGIEESAALAATCDVVDAKPEFFSGLADEDQGDDPDRVETDLVRTRFGEHDVYRELASSVGDLAQRFSDTAIARGALVKPFALAVYAIAKPVSQRDPKIRGLIAPILDYYSSNAKLGAKSRKAKTPTGTPPTTT